MLVTFDTYLADIHHYTSMTKINLLAVNLAFSIPEILMEELNHVGTGIEKPINVLYPEAELHLSIYMGLLDQKRLSDLAKMLQSKMVSITMRGKGICFAKSGNSDQTIVSYCFEENSSIHELHENIATVFRKYTTDVAAKPEMFYQQKAGSSSLQYLNDFSSSHAGEKYIPHITLGYSSQNIFKKPNLFSHEILFDQAFLYLLGDACTCAQRVHRVL